MCRNYLPIQPGQRHENEPKTNPKFIFHYGIIKIHQYNLHQDLPHHPLYSTMVLLK